MQAEQWQYRIGRRMIVVTAVLLLGLMTWLFDIFLDREYNPNRRPETVVTAQGQTSVRLKPNRQGHYMVTAHINGQPVQAMLDTGATRISIPGPLAKKLRLQPGARSYAHTAGGRVPVYAAVLDSVQIGAIRQEDLRAAITPTMDGDMVLIGMNFLKHLQLAQEDETLILQEP